MTSNCSAFGKTPASCGTSPPTQPCGPRSSACARPSAVSPRARSHPSGSIPDKRPSDARHRSHGGLRFYRAARLGRLLGGQDKDSSHPPSNPFTHGPFVPRNPGPPVISNTQSAWPTLPSHDTSLVFCHRKETPINAPLITWSGAEGGASGRGNTRRIGASGASP